MIATPPTIENKKEEEKKKPQAHHLHPQGLLDAPERVPGAIPEPEKATRGEWLFHKATYTGVGYFANFMLSVVLWDLCEKRLFKGALFNGFKNGFTKGFETIGLSAARSAKWGAGAAKYTFSPLGGHLLMWPIKKLEDNARWLVHKANVMFDRNYVHKDLDVTRHSDEKELPPLFDEPTKQTWGQIAIRRGISWVAVIAAGIGLQSIRLDKFSNHRLAQGRSIEKGIEDGLTYVVNKGVDYTKKGGWLDRFRKSDIGQNYIKLSALDSTLTVLTASIIAMTKNWFGKDKDVNGNGNGHAHEEAPAAAVTPPTATEPPMKSFVDDLKRQSPVERTSPKPAESWKEAEAHRAASAPEMQVSA